MAGVHPAIYGESMEGLKKMRAIDKGGSPYKEIDEYQDAIPYLERKLVYIVLIAKCQLNMFRK